MNQSTIPEAEPLITPAPKSLARAVIVGAAALFALCAAVVFASLPCAPYYDGVYARLICSPSSSDAIASLPSKLKDAPGLCERGVYVPKCQHAYHFGACTSPDVPEISDFCSDTCTACPEEQQDCSNMWRRSASDEGVSVPADYAKPLPVGSRAYDQICAACTISPMQSCCFNYDSSGEPIAADGTPLPGCGTTQGRRLGGTGAKACYGNGPCPYQFRSR